jgi:uncharacterized protein (DUF488 family)
VDELVTGLLESGVSTLVDVRRFPSSRRNPQFNRDALAAVLSRSGIEYRHAIELGGRRSDEPGEERFGCIGVSAFRSYAARMASPEWQAAFDSALDASVPCFMCAETPWWRCHRRLIAELLTARGDEIVHLLRPGESQAHRLYDESAVREGKLYLCGERVA